MYFVCETTASNLIDMISTELHSLLPQGEGQDEGLYKTESYLLLIPHRATGTAVKK